MRSLAWLGRLLFLAFPGSGRADADHAAIAKASLEQYIRPGYAEFAAGTAGLKDATGALCDDADLPRR